jgi:hypothetical protein
MRVLDEDGREVHSGRAGVAPRPTRRGSGAARRPHFNASYAASVFGHNEEVAVPGGPTPSDPLLSLADRLVIVSRENFRVVSRGFLSGPGLTDDRRYIAL